MEQGQENRTLTWPWAPGTYIIAFISNILELEECQLINAEGIKEFLGTSLVVQWLRLHTTQGVWVRSLVGELRSHMACGQKTKT